MRLTIYHAVLSAALANAQGDLLTLLQSQPDLSTLTDLLGLADLTDTLAQSTNITIIAPTNQAFEKVDPTIPEGVAVANRNVTSVSALLSNHVFRGLYPAASVGEVPTFVQSLLTPDFLSDVQPFTNFTGGQYNGVVKDGADLKVLSGEFGVSKVIEADIFLGSGIVIHKVDTLLTFGAPLQLFTARAGYTALNGALSAADIGINLGLSDGASRNVSDLTIFVPTNEAFELIGSVLENADQETLRSVLKHHFITDNVIFSPSISNKTEPSLQGSDLQFTVTDDGAIFVNGAKVVLPNVILYNAVAHVIDGVLNPLAPPPDRASLDASAAASDRVAFADATPVVALPFTSATFTDETESYTIPAIYNTGLAVAPASSDAFVTVSASTTSNGTATATPVAYTGAADVAKVARGMLFGVVGGAIAMAI